MTMEIELVNPNELKRDPNQPRTVFDEDNLQKMAMTYKNHGIMDPVEVDENNTIIRGERRWRAAEIAGVRVPIKRVVGLDQKTRFERQLIEHSEDYPTLDKAWAYGTAVVNINGEVEGTDRVYTVPELKEMDQGPLLNLIEVKREGVERGQEIGGTSKLARIIGEDQETIWNYIQVLYLEPKTQEMVGPRGTRLYVRDPVTKEMVFSKRVPYTCARVISRLYPGHPKEMREFEKNLRDGKYRTRVDLEDAVNKYLGDYEEKLQRKTREKRKEKVKEDKKKDEDEREGDVDVDEGKVEDEADKRSIEPTEAEKKFLDKFGGGRSLEGKIRLAKEGKVADDLIEEWESVAERLRPLLFVDDEQVISECTKYMEIIDKVRNNKKAKENIVKKIRDALDLGLDVTGYNQRLAELVENETVKDNEKQFLKDIEADIVAPRNKRDAEKEITRAEKEGVDETKIEEFRTKLTSLVESKEIGRPEVLEEFINEVQREVALKRAGDDIITDARDEGKAEGVQKAIDSPEETEKKLLWNATEGLDDLQRELLQAKAVRNNWAPTSVGALTEALLTLEEPIRIMLLDESSGIGYNVILKITKISEPADQVEVITYLDKSSLDGKKAERLVQKIIDGESLDESREDVDRAPLGLAEKYAQYLERSFYGALNFAQQDPIPATVMGKDVWLERLPLITGSRIIWEYLEQLDLDVPVDEYPRLPALPFDVDEEKVTRTELTEAEYTVLDKEEE